MFFFKKKTKSLILSLALLALNIATCEAYTSLSLPSPTGLSNYNTLAYYNQLNYAVGQGGIGQGGYGVSVLGAFRNAFASATSRTQSYVKQSPYTVSPYGQYMPSIAFDANKNIYVTYMPTISEMVWSNNLAANGGGGISNSPYAYYVAAYSTPIAMWTYSGGGYPSAPTLFLAGGGTGVSTDPVKSGCFPLSTDPQGVVWCLSMDDGNMYKVSN